CGTDEQIRGGGGRTSRARVELHIPNEPKRDVWLKLPFSSRHYVECLTLGAEKFGWSKRTQPVGSMKRDGLTLGWGMAGATWIAGRFAGQANVQLRDGGHGRGAGATHENRPGSAPVPR